MRKGIKTFFCHPKMIIICSFVIPYFMASFISGMLILAGNDHPLQGVQTEKEADAIQKQYEQEADKTGHQEGLKYGSFGVILALCLLGGTKIIRAMQSKSKKTDEEL